MATHELVTFDTCLTAVVSVHAAKVFERRSFFAGKFVRKTWGTAWPEEERLIEANAGESPETWRDWMVVVTATISLTFSVTHIYSMGVFILPIETDTGWSRGDITGGLTAVSIVSVILSPFVGWLIDRLGSRRISILGILIFCTTLALVSTTSRSILNWWLLWSAVALGAVFIKPTVWMSAIAKRFRRRRGLAMGVAFCGLGFGAAIMPYLTSILISLWGWRIAYVALAMIACVMALPMILIFFRDLPDRRGNSNQQGEVFGMGIAEGFRSPAFLKLALTAFLAAAATIGLTVHFVPILVGYSMGTGEAAAITSVIGIASIIGRILTGFLLDRLRGNLIAPVAFGLPAFACIWLLAFDGSALAAIGIAIIIGFSLGAETDVVGYLATRYFGLRNYGVLFGTIVGLLTFAAGVGPMVGGVIHDHYGNYNPLIWGALSLFLVCSALMGSLGDYPDAGVQK